MNGNMLDTNVIIKYFSGDQSAKQLIDSYDNISISAIVVGELHYGAHKSAKKDSNLAMFSGFLSNFIIISVDENVSSIYGEIKDKLRSKGVNISENDMWIAATAISQNSRLLTYDKHFSQINGLNIES